MAESVAILCNVSSHESDLAAPGRSLPVPARRGEAGRKRVKGPTLQGRRPGIEEGQLGQNRSAGGF